MKFYEYGITRDPVILLIPGTCCHHSIFDEVVSYLKERLYCIVVSFDGFDETEDTIYRNMEEETEKIESFIMEKYPDGILCAYGCSLGGSYVSYLMKRDIIHIKHGIIGSSDLDHASETKAKILSDLVVKIIYPIVYKGKLPSFMEKVNEFKIKKHPESKEYREKFTKIFTDSPLKGYVKKESVWNQYYYDLVSDTKMNRKCSIHVFYAAKMGKKYEEKYRDHFTDPDIRYHDMEHEELLMCYPEKWAEEVLDCVSGRK